MTSWIGWQVGMTGPTVQAAKRKLKAKFSYAKGLDDTEHFGEDLAAVVIVFQTKKNADPNYKGPKLRTDGVLDYNTQDALGMIAHAPPPRHTIFTVNGFLGDMWTGYPAICGQAMDVNKCYWQPIGWTNNQVPMTQNIDGGVAALIEQINLHPGTFLFALYSEGEIVGAKALQELQTGSLKHRMKDFIGAVTFGAPMREAGSRPPGCPDPGGRGIARDRTVNTPDFWWDYADPGDMYTCTPNGDEGDDITACYQAIAQSNLVGGQQTLAKQMVKLLTNLVGNVGGLLKAIIKAIGFFGSGVASHVHYHDREIVPGVTYLDHAIGHLFERANAVTPRAA